MKQRWDSLQARWAAGEALSSEEQAERLAGAAGDPLAARELELFAGLRAHGAGSEAVPPTLVERVLDAVGARPRLLRVAPGERAPASRERALPPTKRRVWLLGAAVLVPLAAAAGTIFWLRATPTPARQVAVAAVAPTVAARSELVLVSGEVEAPSGTRVGGRPLAPGDRVSTGAGRACLSVDPGIDVCLAPRSSIVVDSLASRAVRLRVERGTALAALSRREPGHSFSLLSGDVAATAHGTVFAVERSASSQVDVVVMEGAVDVAHGKDARELVPVHSRVRFATPASAAERASMGRGEEAHFWALLRERELWAKPELGVLEIPLSATAGVEVAVDRGSMQSLPFRAFVPAGRRALTLRSASGAEQSTEVDIVAGETTALDPNQLLLRPGAPEAPAEAPSAEALLARARHEIAQGNARAALALYDRVRTTHPASPEARTVLVTIGKLELDLKQPARALASFDAYLASGGPLGPEALGGKIRALRALGRVDDEKSAIQQYLARYPEGFEAPLLRQRLQVLQRR